jgi:hypothetical protein
MTASAQTTNIYYGANDTVIRPQTQTWAGHYWYRVDNAGTPATGASSFAFTSAVPNTRLFNPIRAGRQTLETVNLMPVSFCENLENLSSIGSPTDPEALGVTTAFRSIMTTGTITTSISNNPQGTYEHLNLILSQAYSPTWWFGGGGDDLGSEDLPLMHMSAPMYNAALALNVSTDSMNTLADMMNASWGWVVATSSGKTEAQALIQGGSSAADDYALLVEQFLRDHSVYNLAAVKVNAHFGIYGQLPMIQANLDDCFVLIDPFTGNLSGPFELGTALDGRGLLGFYSTSGEYELGSDVRYFNSGGCEVTVGGEWHNSPPCWLCTYTPTWPSPADQWHCSEYGIDSNGNVACVCEYGGNGTGTGTPATVPIRQNCRCGPAGSGCGGNVPASPATPGVLPPSPTGCAGPCAIQYFY